MKGLYNKINRSHYRFDYCNKRNRAQRRAHKKCTKNMLNKILNFN